MQVLVRFFAGCREAAGIESVTILLSQGATLRELREALARQYPALSRYLERIRYSVNWEYVASDVPLREGDEVALIPPVAGGEA